MIVIADSGSSQSKWALVSPSGEVRQKVAEPLNPRFTDDATFRATVETVVEEGRQVEAMYFYGSGCGSSDGRERYTALLRQICPCADVVVESDLEGACRACGGYGLVGILGTGSHVCMYDGRRVVEQAVSLGYVLGDEGSGNHIGRMLCKDYWSHRMPDDLAAEFGRQFPGTLPQFLDRLYRGVQPNRYLAERARFVLPLRGHPYVQRLLRHCFDQYMQTLVVPLHERYPDAELGLVGGVARLLDREITDAADRAGLKVRTIQINAIEGLVKFHCRRGNKV